MSKQVELLEQALVLTNSLEALITAQDWEKVAELERERKSMLEACFSEKSQPEDLDKVRELITKLRDKNDRLVGMTLLEKNRISQSTKLLRKQQLASAAYLDCEDD